MPEPTRANATASALLASAEAILDGSQRISAGLRARAAALLARQALEQALREFWEARAPAVHKCNVRAQIQCLAAYADPARVAAAASAWNRLSDACHHHPYDVAPGADELRSWIGSVRVFCETAVRQHDSESEANA